MTTSRAVKTLLKHTANFIIQAETDGEEYETDEELIAGFTDYLKMIGGEEKPAKKARRTPPAPPASYSNDWWTRVIVAVFCTFPCWLFSGSKKNQKKKG